MSLNTNTSSNPLSQKIYNLIEDRGNYSDRMINICGVYGDYQKALLNMLKLIVQEHINRYKWDKEFDRKTKSYLDEIKYKRDRPPTYIEKYGDSDSDYSEDEYGYKYKIISYNGEDRNEDYYIQEWNLDGELIQYHYMTSFCDYLNNQSNIINELNEINKYLQQGIIPKYIQELVEKSKNRNYYTKNHT